MTSVGCCRMLKKCSKLFVYFFLYLFDGVGHEQYVHAAKSQLCNNDKNVDQSPGKNIRSNLG